MQNDEEIFMLIKKCFYLSLKISIRIPEDLVDGHYYLELLKTCRDVDISTSKNKNYETIEIVLDEFYGFQTNKVIDYYEFIYSPKNETIIILCFFCIVFYEKFREIPLELKDDIKRLSILTKPVYYCLKKKMPPSARSFSSAIEKAKRKEFDEASLSDSSSNRMSKRKNQKSKNENIDDEDFTFSGSIISESSKEDSSEDDLIDHNQLSEKIFINGIRNVNPQTFFPSTYNSTKSKNSKKYDRQIQKMSLEIEDLKQTVHHANEEMEKLTESERKLKTDNSKLKNEYQKLVDHVDCLKSKLEENELIYSTKNKELDKMKIDLELHKKQIGEKSDEIKQLKNSNHKLQQDICDLHRELKIKFHESKNFESEIREKRNLEKENVKLKEDLDDLHNYIRESQNSEHFVIAHDISVENPTSDIEIGESLDIINQKILTELREELERKKMMMENEVESFKFKIDQDNVIIEELSNSEQKMTSKYLEVLKEFENSQLQLSMNEDECNRLKDRIVNLEKEKGNFRKEVNDLFDKTKRENVLQRLKYLFSENHYSDVEKNELFCLARCVLGIEYEFRENEMLRICQQMTGLKEEINEKNSHIKDMYKVIDENQIQLFNLKQELTDCQIEKENINRSSEMFKLKGEEKESYIRRIQGENEEMSVKIRNLGAELFIAKKDLDKVTKDCNEYKQVILNATMENRSKRYINRSCQANTLMYLNQKDNVGQRPSNYGVDIEKKLAFQNPVFKSPHRQMLVNKPDFYKNEQRDDSNNILNYICNLSESEKNSDTSLRISKILDSSSINNYESYTKNSKPRRKSVHQKKVDSPAVKPARLHQMISRNLQQPSHMRTSYPVETQALTQDYLNQAVNGIHLDESKSASLVSSASTNLGQKKKYHDLNMISKYRDANDEIIENLENSTSNKLIKPKINLSSKKLSFRPSNNIISSKTNDFKKPLHLVNVRQIKSNGSDKENIISFHNDKGSIASSSIKYEIINSPIGKCRGLPGMPKKKFNRIK